MDDVLRIFYVEDDEDIRHVTAMALEGEGFELTAYESGQLALNDAAYQTPDVLLLDVMMPGMDGPMTLRKLRELPHLAKTPVIFMTAKVNSAEVGLYKAIGAVGVISKPFDPMTLADQIRGIVTTATQKRISDKALSLRTLQERFSKLLPQRIADIQNQWEECTEGGDASELFRSIHSLAGAAGTFGFHRLGEQARTLERLMLENRDALNGTEKIPAIVRLLENLLLLISHDPDQLAPDNVEGIVQEKSSKERAASVVYLLEDDEMQSEEVAVQLRHFGYGIEVFHTALELKNAVERHVPAVLLIDIHLSEGERAGFDTVIELRDGNARNVPVIFISKSDTWEHRLAAVRAGGQAYLKKPLNFSMLVEELDEVAGNKRMSPYRILVVDDTALLAQHYATVLENAGMLVGIVTDPAQLLNVLTAFTPDLVLMDIYMPGCNGVEAAQVIRQQQVYMNIPIVYLSTETSLTQQLEALHIGGGDDFLQKPISDAYLVDAVRIRAKRFRDLSALLNQDGLTGLLNHINLKLALEREMSQVQRRASSLAFIMLDIDLFKSVNDDYGHLMGDRVIKSLARLLIQRLRKGDIAARYGGEEFALILPDTSLEFAYTLIDDLRLQFSKIRHVHEEGEFNVTFSAGVALCPTHKDMQSLIVAADAALYRAKQDGRNQVVIDGDER